MNSSLAIMRLNLECTTTYGVKYDQYISNNNENISDKKCIPTVHIS